MNIAVHVFLQLALLSSLSNPLSEIKTTYPVKHGKKGYVEVEIMETVIVRFKKKEQGPIKIEGFLIQEKKTINLTLSHANFEDKHSNKHDITLKGKVGDKDLNLNLSWKNNVDGFLRGSVGGKNWEWYAKIHSVTNNQGTVKYLMEAKTPGYYCEVDGENKAVVTEVHFNVKTKCEPKESSG